MFYDYFESPFGLIKIVANKQFLLECDFINKIGIKIKSNKVTDITKKFLQNYFAHKQLTFPQELIDFNNGKTNHSVFKKVFKTIAYGQKINLIDFKKTNNSKAHSDLATVLLNNPIKIIIPTHRIVNQIGKSKNNKQEKLNKLLLFHEQEFIMNQKLKTYLTFNDQEINKLKTHQKFMTFLDKTPISNKVLVFKDPFVALISRVIFQQIANDTARKIMARLAYYLEFNMTASRILGIPGIEFKNMGIGTYKVNYLKNVCQFVLENKDVWKKIIVSKDKEYISEHLETIKGFGKWSVWTFLLFGLKWKNVFEIDDLILKRCLPKILSKNNILKKDFHSFIKNYEDIGSLISINMWQKASEF